MRLVELYLRESTTVEHAIDRLATNLKKVFQYSRVKGYIPFNYILSKFPEIDDGLDIPISKKSKYPTLRSALMQYSFGPESNPRSDGSWDRANQKINFRTTADISSVLSHEVRHLIDHELTSHLEPEVVRKSIPSDVFFSSDEKKKKEKERLLRKSNQYAFHDYTSPGDMQDASKVAKYKAHKSEVSARFQQVLHDLRDNTWYLELLPSAFIDELKVLLDRHEIKWKDNVQFRKFANRAWKYVQAHNEEAANNKKAEKKEYIHKEPEHYFELDELNNYFNTKRFHPGLTVDAMNNILYDMNELYHIDGIINNGTIVVKDGAPEKHVEIIGSRYKPLIQKILNDGDFKDTRHRYVPEEDWKPYEQEIAKNSDLATTYAIQILKNKFPLGEDEIYSNFANGMWYADTFEKGNRIPKFEEYLLKTGNLDQMIQYATDAAKQRWPELEQILEKHPKFKVHYEEMMKHRGYNK